jgi:hypothetical protein
VKLGCHFQWKWAFVVGIIFGVCRGRKYTAHCICLSAWQLTNKRGRIEAFTANKCTKTISSNRPRHDRAKNKNFGGLFCLRHEVNKRNGSQSLVSQYVIHVFLTKYIAFEAIIIKYLRRFHQRDTHTFHYSKIVIVLGVIKIRFPFVPFFPGQSLYSYNVPLSRIHFKCSLFKCSSLTLISIDNRSVTDVILCNWHFYNDVNTPGG